MENKLRVRVILGVGGGGEFIMGVDIIRSSYGRFIIFRVDEEEIISNFLFNLK